MSGKYFRRQSYVGVYLEQTSVGQRKYQFRICMYSLFLYTC